MVSILLRYDILGMLLRFLRRVESLLFGLIRVYFLIPAIKDFVFDEVNGARLLHDLWIVLPLDVLISLADQTSLANH